MVTSLLLKFLTLKWNILRTIWCIEIGDGSFFCIFHALSFELNFFRPEAPFNIEMEQLKNKVTVQEKLVSTLQDSLDDIQGRMRRNTVVICRIPESRKEEGSWSECKKLVAKLLREHLDMPSAVEDIERAHRSPVALHPERKTPKPIFVAFLRWKTANEVISKSPSSLKKKPWRDEVTNSVIPILVEQMFSLNVSKLRQQAVKKHRELKDGNPSWTVFLHYPAKLFYKQNEEDRPQEYVWTPGLS